MSIFYVEVLNVSPCSRITGVDTWIYGFCGFVFEWIGGGWHLFEKEHFYWYVMSVKSTHVCCYWMSNVVFYTYCLLCLLVIKCHLSLLKALIIEINLKLLVLIVLNISDWVHLRLWCSTVCESTQWLGINEQTFRTSSSTSTQLNANSRGVDA